MSPAAEPIWGWFWELHQGRQVGANGYLPISASDMKAWEAMTGNIVRREEWQMLREMDRALLDAVSKRDGNGQGARASSHEMTAATFDAVFG